MLICRHCIGEGVAVVVWKVCLSCCHLKLIRNIVFEVSERAFILKVYFLIFLISSAVVEVGKYDVTSAASLLAC